MMPRKRKEQPDQYNAVFPKRLRKLLEQTTHQELATALGKTRQAISYYADGSSSPDWETIAAIADFFNVSTEYLLREEGVASRDAEIQAICNYTGLSLGAIKNLHCEACGALGNEPIDTLISGLCFEDYHRFNWLLGKSFFASVLHAMVGHKSKMIDDVQPVLDFRGVPRFDLDELEKFSIYELTEELTSQVKSNAFPSKIPDWIWKFFGINDNDRLKLYLEGKIQEEDFFGYDKKD